MSSALWLLLYLAPLLGLTAAVFGWFGWHWRGTSQPQPRPEPEPEPPPTATPLENTADADQLAEQTAGELLALRAELETARNEARQSQIATTKARETAQSLETAAAKHLQDLDLLRGERDQAAAELKAAQTELAALRARLEETGAAPAPAEPAAPPAKPKRKRAAPAKSKPATGSIQDRLAALVNELSQHQSTVSALTQERDDWQRQVARLAEKTPADPAGLGLARRSLADSEARLQTASTEIDRLQTQARVLHQADAIAATLDGVPDDDLTQIKGIKKVINAQLHACGIRTWRQIARWSDTELRVFSDLLAFKNRATREKWQEQARALHEAAHGPL